MGEQRIERHGLNTGETMEQRDQPDSVRETFTEYDDDETMSAVIQDPQNSRAWIESTVSRPIER